MSVVKKSENLEKIGKKPSSKPEEINVDKIEAEAEIGSEMSKISAEVADLGIDSAESEGSGEGFSEKKGDKKDFSAGKQQAQTKQDLKAHIPKVVSIRVMQKEVASEIRKEIRKEERKILLAYVGVKKYSPDKLTKMVSKIRNLKDLLGNLLSATKEILSSLYLKWVKKEI